MNREIKFRALNKQNEWVYGSLIYDVNEKWYIHQNNFVFWAGYCEIIPQTISQFTGLKDKNGKEIYEGDICIGNDHIENDNEKFIIKYGKYKTDEWKEKYSCNTYQFGLYAEFIKTKSQVHLVSPNGIEVIGNIYESE